MLKRIILGFVVLSLAGCSSYGVIENAPLQGASASSAYSLKNRIGRQGSGDISLMLAFSGGGTRAAALALGVLEELRDTRILIDGVSQRVLDEVDVISSVSGGSFTSAYFGLYGERVFEDFEQEFLKYDVERRLIEGLFNPLRWFSSKGRTEMAVKLYEDQVFHHASFADLQRKDGPLILINASDLGYGVRFSFIQEYFNLLCSDISSFSVARAVAASSSVPVLFNPVVVENYQDCKHARPPWLQSAEQRLANDPQMMQVVGGLDTYFDLDNRQYAHFVDGGITDNLGLRAIYEIIEVAGGAKTLIDKLGRETPRNVVVISVNASTDPEPVMDHSNKQPSLEETINAVTDVQLHRYNAATLELMKHSVSRWADELSTDEKTVTPYFIQVGFRDVAQPERRRFFNRIPTSFSLTDEQVDELIITGRQLLRSNADFQRFLSNLGGARVTGRETSL